MEKRRFDKLGIETSLLGFGCMRFPTKPDGSIDEELAEQMLDEAYAAGVTYFDTAFPYHDGESEPFVGRVMKKYDRSSFYFATKLPIWEMKNQENARQTFLSQLERLQTDYVDFYLLHAMDKRRFQMMKDMHILEMCEEMRAAGKIRYLGFSFHDKYEVFEEMLTYYDWDFCQIQYNYMDTERNPGDKGYELAERLGIPMVIMEPIRGGMLSAYSDDIEGIFKKVRPDKSVSSWALRWVASHPNVKVILSGMSSPEHVRDNLDTFNHYEEMTDAEKNTVEDVVTALRARMQNACTGCRYCMPCPMGVNIPRNFHMWNEYHIYGNDRMVKGPWMHMPDKERPTNCVGCGKCEAMCPQKISIREDLKRVQAEFSTRAQELGLKEEENV